MIISYLSIPYIFRMVFIGGVLQCVVMMLAVICGSIIFGFYALRGCDPYKAGYMTNVNQVGIIFFHNPTFFMS